MTGRTWHQILIDHIMCTVSVCHNKGTRGYRVSWLLGIPSIRFSDWYRDQMVYHSSSCLADFSGLPVKTIWTCMSASFCHGSASHHVTLVKRNTESALDVCMVNPTTIDENQKKQFNTLDYRMSLLVGSTIDDWRCDTGKWSAPSGTIWQNEY